MEKDVILHITEAKYLQDYKVQVVFNDGKQGVADLSDALLDPMGQTWLQNMSISGLLKIFLNYRSNFRSGDIKIRN